jgi:hypothetical protein
VVAVSGCWRGSVFGGHGPPYAYADALGSVRLMTNASGTPVESYTYDPYGQPRVMYTVGDVSGAGPDGNWLTEDATTYTSSWITRGNPILFTGRWWDSM